MRKNEDWLGELMREYALRLDRTIERDEREWRDRVPESLDNRVAALAAGAIPFEPALDRLMPRPSTVVKKAASAAAKGGMALKAIAITVAAAAAVSAGACAASPAVRGRVGGLLAACARISDTRSALSPGDYIIPSPGEGFTVTDEAKSANMHGCWFTSDDREALVQIAASLPEGTEVSEDAEAIPVGDRWGTIEETESTCVLILNDGGVMIRVEFWGAQRDEVIDYAAGLLAENHMED